jgi:lysophospholipase L1-like esterase
MGDSITEGLADNAPSYPDRLAAMTGKTVVNLGNGGEHAYEGAARIIGVLEQYKPGRVNILYGVNDLFHGHQAAAIADDIRFMIRVAKNNRTQIRVGTLLPIPGHDGMYEGSADDVSELIRQVAAEEGASVADLDARFGDGTGLMRDDGVHPNRDGNGVIARAFR